MDQLWDKWETHYKNNKIDVESICKDGIANENIGSFHEQPLRILFIGKECNDWKGGDMRWLARNGPKHIYLHNLSRWASGLLNNFPEFKKINNWNYLNKSLNQIALINLKKTSGGASSDAVQISAYAKNDNELLKEQIKLINPNIIICLATHEILIWLLNLEANPDTPDEKPYFSKTNNAWIIPWMHPSFRGSAEARYNQLRKFVSTEDEFMNLIKL